MNKKIKSENNKKEDQRLNDLAGLVYKHELLCNELFHLKEYISLKEFDPSYRNKSASYDTFLKDNALSISSLGQSSNNEAVSNTASRVRNRQLRHTTKEQSNVQGKDWLDDISHIIDERYDELSLKINDKKNKLEDSKSNLKLTVKQDTNGKRANKSEIMDNDEGDLDSNYTTRVKNETSLHSILRKHKITKKQKNRQIKYEPNGDFAEEPIFTNTKEHKSTDLKLINDNRNKKRISDSSLTAISNDVSEEDDYYFTTSSEDSEPPLTKRKRMNIKLPKIKLTVHPPKQTITNAGHIVNPEFNGLEDYLNSFKSMDEDISNEEYDNYIKEQRTVLAQIRKGLASGALKYDEETDSIQPITTKDAKLGQLNKPSIVSYIYKEQNLQVHQDTLVKHGVMLSKLFQNNRRAQILRARKVSQMIEQHFKHIAGAEERKLKEEEKHRKLLARSAMQAVKKRWHLAEKAYRVLKKDEEQELKRIQGKEHLSKVLQQSSQLLGAQLANKNVLEQNEGLNSSELDESSIDSSSNEDYVTSSEEDEMEKVSIDDVGTSLDKNLSVDELREKYRFLQQESDDTSIEQSKADEHSENVPFNHGKRNELGLSALLSNTISEDEDDDEVASLVTATEDSTNSSDSEEMNITSSDDEENLETLEEGNESTGPAVEDISPTNDSPKNKTFSPEDPNPLSVVDVPIPSLLRGTLRVYQKQGLNWLASLYNNNTNGILADEMGLGKTIQTISLLSYLACEKENWGPHLVVVPTSVLLNWEMEFKKFAPGFKVLTYYGSPQQRKEKRKGWNKKDAFHVCIVSYQLVVQDQHCFKRKKWQYMILDEAHNIKNFRSTRWQALLNFNTQRRLLLTGTPLQNNIAELWSLLYFLMPQTVTNGKGISGFADLDAFQQWFGKPVNQIIEGGHSAEEDSETKDTVEKLHKVLRPYLLRRLKADVEKQMPGKYEHIVYCRLSKRQRFLYDDFMSRAQTKATLASGNFMSIVNCLMQLRKVCNHPDLFEVRPVMSSFCVADSVLASFSDKQRYIYSLLHNNDYKEKVNFSTLNLVFSKFDGSLFSQHSNEISKLKCIDEFTEEITKLRANANFEHNKKTEGFDFTRNFFKTLGLQKLQENIESVKHQRYLNHLRCEIKPVYGRNLIQLLEIQKNQLEDVSFSNELVKPLQTRLLTSKDIIQTYAVVTPNAITLNIRPASVGLDADSSFHEVNKSVAAEVFHNMNNPFHQLQTKLTIAFPDKSLLQYDCGKLQRLAILLQELKDNGHRALIFTQMTKVLDILEQFLNYHGYLYMRLDGATKIEDRQILTERFNSDPRVTVFILSSRSGGLGINLTGADSVIFYDSDWNPAMDKQCQDRCHRIGQTRDVHIYRFVSEHTIESNILKKANQKRHLDNLVIQQGDFTTDYLTKLSVNDILRTDDSDANIPGTDKPLLLDNLGSGVKGSQKLESLLAQAEDEEDVKAANLAMKEIEVDDEDFDEHKSSANESKENSELILYEGTKHIEEYMLRFIANGYYY